MLKRLVRFVAGFAFAIGEAAEIDRMLERSDSRVFFRRPRGIVEHSVADVAVVADDLASVAHVLTIVTAEATGRVQMADIIRMRLPIRLHFREEVSLKDALNLFCAGL